MKSLLLLAAITCVFSTAASAGFDLECRDNETNFPGSFFMTLKDSKYIESAYYSAAKNGTKPNYQIVKSLVANPSNAAMKGGSEYFLEVLTAKGLIKSQAKLNTQRDTLSIDLDSGEQYFLDCAKIQK